MSTLMYRRHHAMGSQAKAISEEALTSASAISPWGRLTPVPALLGRERSPVALVQPASTSAKAGALVGSPGGRHSGEEPE